MSNQIPEHIREYVRLREKARAGEHLTREERHALADHAIRSFTRTVRDERGEHQRATRSQFIDFSGIYAERARASAAARERVQTERVRDAIMSTEFAVVRRLSSEYAFREVLVHKPEACDLRYICSGRAPALVQHDHARQCGVIDAAGLLGATLRGTLRFGRGKDGDEMWNDVEDRIRRNVSLGYGIRSGEYIAAQRDGELDTLLIDDWEPIECSLVSVGADPDAIILDA
jgi:hypothetical protein